MLRGKEKYAPGPTLWGGKVCGAYIKKRGVAKNTYVTKPFTASRDGSSSL